MLVVEAKVIPESLAFTGGSTLVSLLTSSSSSGSLSSLGNSFLTSTAAYGIPSGKL